MAWSFKEHAPVYIQIAEKIRREIIKGVYVPGEQIPPVRQLAVDAAVNPNTMQRAFGELEKEGLLCPRGTQGCFVTEDTSVIDAAKCDAARRLVHDFIRQAESMSIGKAELIKMIEEESDK